MLNHIPHHPPMGSKRWAVVWADRRRKRTTKVGRSVGRLLGGIFIVIQQRGETPLHRRPPTHHPPKDTHNRASEREKDRRPTTHPQRSHSLSQSDIIPQSSSSSRSSSGQYLSKKDYEQGVRESATPTTDDDTNTLSQCAFIIQSFYIC